MTRRVVTRSSLLSRPTLAEANTSRVALFLLGLFSSSCSCCPRLACVALVVLGLSSSHLVLSSSRSDCPSHLVLPSSCSCCPRLTRVALVLLVLPSSHLGSSVVLVLSSLPPCSLAPQGSRTTTRAAARRRSASRARGPSGSRRRWVRARGPRALLLRCCGFVPDAWPVGGATIPLGSRRDFSRRLASGRCPDPTGPPV